MPNLRRASKEVVILAQTQSACAVKPTGIHKTEIKASGFPIKSGMTIALSLLLTGCSTPLTTVETRTVNIRSAASPQHQARVELGFRLWFEPRLSGNDRMNCGTCHQFHKGFSNGMPVATGITGAKGKRNTPTVYGLSGGEHFFWDGRAKTLEEQAIGPIENPVEMNAKLDDVIQKLQQVPYYQHKFQEAYGTKVDTQGLAHAIATFERELDVKEAPFDRWLNGDAQAMLPEAVRGYRLFTGKANCMTCHTGRYLTDDRFHNIGVGFGASERDSGRYGVTKNPSDRYAFKTPTLRNIEKTAPYMHDGSLPSLTSVVEYLDRGGHPDPSRSEKIKPLGLTPEERSDLVAFMRSLSSEDNFRAIAKLPGIHPPSWLKLHLQRGLAMPKDDSILDLKP